MSEREYYIFCPNSGRPVAQAPAPLVREFRAAHGMPVDEEMLEAPRCQPRPALEAPAQRLLLK